MLTNIILIYGSSGTEKPNQMADFSVKCHTIFYSLFLINEDSVVFVSVTASNSLLSCVSLLHVYEVVQKELLHSSGLDLFK